MLAQGLQGIYGDRPIRSTPANTVDADLERLDVPGRRSDATATSCPTADLTNPLANGECGAMANTDFGSPFAGDDLQSRPPRRLGRAALQLGVLDRRAARAAAARVGDVGYFRRWYGNFTVTDNLRRRRRPTTARSASRRRPIRGCPAAAATRSPDCTISTRTRSGQVNNYFTLASDYGKQIEHWNGVDLTVNARPGAGHAAAGRRQHRPHDDRQLRRRGEGGQPEPAVLPRRDAFLTQVKFLGSYTVPRVDVQVSGTVQSVPGPQIGATYVASNALVAPSLGRSLSGNAANVNVALVEPGTMYGDRLNQVDLRVGKILKFGKTRTAVNLDLFNALQSQYGPDRQQQLRELAAAAVDRVGTAGEDQRAGGLLASAAQGASTTMRRLLVLTAAISGILSASLGVPQAAAPPPPVRTAATQHQAVVSKYLRHVPQRPDQDGGCVVREDYGLERRRAGGRLGEGGPQAAGRHDASAGSAAPGRRHV